MQPELPQSRLGTTSHVPPSGLSSASRKWKGAVNLKLLSSLTVSAHCSIITKCAFLKFWRGFSYGSSWTEGVVIWAGYSALYERQRLGCKKLTRTSVLIIFEQICFYLRTWQHIQLSRGLAHPIREHLWREQVSKRQKAMFWFSCWKLSQGRPRTSLHRNWPTDGCRLNIHWQVSQSFFFSITSSFLWGPYGCQRTPNRSCARLVRHKPPTKRSETARHLYLYHCTQRDLSWAPHNCGLSQRWFGTKAKVGFGFHVVRQNVRYQRGFVRENRRLTIWHEIDEVRRWSLYDSAWVQKGLNILKHPRPRFSGSEHAFTVEMTFQRLRKKENERWRSSRFTLQKRKSSRPNLVNQTLLHMQGFLSRIYL